MLFHRTILVACSALFATALSSAAFAQCGSCGGWGVPCHATSPQRMIPPPIKRSRIPVSSGVVIVISVKL